MRTMTFGAIALLRRSSPISHVTSLRFLSVGAVPMKRIKMLVVPAALSAIVGVAGCNGHETYETGMPIIDRWASPGVVMEPGTVQYADPPKLEQPKADPPPAPAPPSKLIRPNDGKAVPPNPGLVVPSPPKTSEVSAPTLYGPNVGNDDPFFEDEAGYTPVPGY
jgi:hypothetical protein